VPVSRALIGKEVFVEACAETETPRAHPQRRGRGPRAGNVSAALAYFKFSGRGTEKSRARPEHTGVLEGNER
jgi:hypothetical protein